MIWQVLCYFKQQILLDKICLGWNIKGLHHWVANIEKCFKFIGIWKFELVAKTEFWILMLNIDFESAALNTIHCIIKCEEVEQLSVLDDLLTEDIQQKSLAVVSKQLIINTYRES